MNHRNLRTAMRVGMLPAGIAIALAPAFAVAQEGGEQSAPTTLDRIEVTGSRIRQASIETANPVIMMTREQIQKQGFTSVGDILQNITTTGSPAISRANALSSGEEVGGQYVDLRNLGPERTLVLLDGKRLGISSNGYSDLASIPTAVVERIEVLTDGASAIYGSDAIAGVINIITRKNFDGLEASGYVGQYGEGDGEVQQYSFLLGSTGERSAITLGVEYSKEEPVYARDREFSAPAGGPWHPLPEAANIPNGWSGNTDVGRIVTSTGQWVLNPGADPSNIANYHRYGTGENFDLVNPNQQMFLRTGIERRSVFATGSFDFTDSIRLNADALYTHRETLQQIAGYPFSSTSSNDGLRNIWSADNAYNPFGEDVQFFRRTSEVPRQTNNELTTYRFSTTLEGAFDIGDKPWNWDAGYVYNQNKGVQTGTGNLFIPNARNALGPSYVDGDGVLQCGTGPTAAGNAPYAGCLPWNPALGFGQAGPGGLTGNQALQDYLFLPTHDTSETTTHIYSLNLSGTVATLPAGDLNMAAGYEHRKEDARFEPDALKQSGLSTDLAGGVTQGGYSLDEVYLEFNVPILADMAFAKELSIDIAGRYSDYDTFGDTVNGKFGLKWRPIEDLLVRGTYATGFRAPSLGDLYGGSSQTFAFYTDPCDTSFGAAAGNPSVAAACQAAGVPADFRQIASGGTEAAGPNQQADWPFLVTSNPNLKPETSKSSTFGFVYSPGFVEGLDVSLDWWKIKIDDVIAAETMTAILNRCYVLGIASSCTGFTRDIAGVDATAPGEIIDATVTLVNGGYQETAGYDFNVRYRLPETSVGNFTIDWKTSYIDYWEYKRDNEAVTPVEQKNSWSVDGNAYFRTRSNLSVDWSLADFGATWSTRYYSGLKEACAYEEECSNPNFTSPYTLLQPTNETGANTFHDVQFRYNTPWNATVAVGANNVFDHQGTYLYTSPNSDFGMYGGFDIGRFYYLKYSQRF